MAENNNCEEEQVNRPACAACKHQRKKCLLGKCILHSIFPASDHVEFKAVHKLFGISNITKLMLKLNVEQRIEAARALKREALLWKMDPIRGASGAISRLSGELSRARQQIRNLHNLVQDLQRRLPENCHHNFDLKGSHFNVFQGVGVQQSFQTQEFGCPHWIEGQHQNQEIGAIEEVGTPQGLGVQRRSFENQVYGANQDIRTPQGLELQHQNFQYQEIGANQEITTPQGPEVQHRNFQNQKIGANQEIEIPQGPEVQSQSFQFPRSRN